MIAPIIAALLGLLALGLLLLALGLALTPFASAMPPILVLVCAFLMAWLACMAWGAGRGG